MTHDSPALRSVVDSNDTLLAIVFNHDVFSTGVHFVTPHDLQQQVALMNRRASEIIPPHTHLPVPRSIRGTQEVLIVLEGNIRADLYDSKRRFIQSEILTGGDVIVLVAGGHGFTIIDDSKFIEVKQGPYVPGKDKEIFAPEGG